MLSRIIPTEKKLKNCKFCSKEKVYPRLAESVTVMNDISIFIECGSCGARGPLSPVAGRYPLPEKELKTAVDKAIRLWNK